MDLIASRHARLEQIGCAIQNLVDQAGGDLDKALTGDTYITDSNGKAIKVGEHLKGLVQLETALASQLGQWDNAAVRAQIDVAREKRISETSAQFTVMIKLLLTDRLLALSSEQKSELPRALERIVQEYAPHGAG